MAINQYQKDGKIYYRIYCQAFGKKNKRLRIQRSLYSIESFEKAVREEKKLIRIVADEMARLENKGLHWAEIIFRWEMAAKHGELGDRYSDPDLYLLHVRRLRENTKHWFNLFASDLKRGDGRSLINTLIHFNCSVSKINKIKSSINLVYNWGIEENLIAAQSSPVEGLIFQPISEKMPRILSLSEIHTLLAEAKRIEHPWYHVWSFALLSGMRSGELMALKWSDIEMEKKIIRVARSFSSSKRVEKSTKNGCWRSVPISPELLVIINDLKVNSSGEFVLPRISNWTNGYAGAVLRKFLKEIGIKKDVVFHTLRACFATHLLASGVEAAKVMAIGGWQDFKTFQVYIRLAGVDISGATDNFSVLPTE